MRRIAWITGTFLLAGLIGVAPPALAEDQGIAWADDTAGDRGADAESDEDSLFPRGGAIRMVAGMFQPPALQPLTVPSETQPFAPTGPAPATGGFEEIGGVPIEVAQRDILAPTASVARVDDISKSAPIDTGEALARSASVQGLDVQRRSSVSFDPHVRGYRQGQIYTQADGAYWFPARLDLDTMLSKIDPGMIQDIAVVPGPYGLRYGPGFAFIDVVRTPTPRYDCFENHFVTSGTVRTNGGQLYGRETVYGGSRDWGYRMSYGHRKGSDYEAGDSLKIPTSYENRDVWGELSYDLTPHQRVDFSYSRFDQTDTEYPGQFFDIGHLGTYAFDVRVVDTDPAGPWNQLTVETWYNNTSFRGDTRNKRNPEFPVLQRVDFALDQQPAGTDNHVEGETRGGNYSSGGRVAARFGEQDDTHINVGADFRYLGQTISEHLVRTFNDAGGAERQDIFTIMPHSWSVDPGMFGEWSSPLTDAWTLSAGARVDYLQTKARAGDLPARSTIDRDSLREDNILYAFYINNRIELSECWTLNSGVGHAQRPPTLIERYSDGLFLGVAQSGFTRVTGDPVLNPERSWQIDLGLTTEQETWRGRVTGFYAWLLDYITYRDDTVVQPQFGDARFLFFANTPAASLAGFELAGEWDWSDWLTPYATMSYVEGRDQTLDAPLTAIPPLDTRLGARLHNAGPQRRWGVECEARVVDNQDRLGTIRVRSTAAEVIEEATPGFTVWNLRGYWNARENLNFFAGIDNLFDKNYQEHLDLRLLGPTGFPGDPTRVLSPGFTPYVGMNWIY